MGGTLSGWARTLWVATVLIVPGGFLFFLAFAFGRVLLRSKRAAVQERGGEAHLRDIIARLSLKDVLREVRTSI